MGQAHLDEALHLVPPAREAAVAAAGAHARIRRRIRAFGALKQPQQELTPAAAVALCSALIAAEMERVRRAPPMHADLVQPFAALQAAARALVVVYRDAHMEVVEADYVGRFDGGLVNLVYAWAQGARFDEVCALCPDIFEGSIIRAIRRLAELLDELRSAAKAIGNDELYTKLAEADKLIRRDIVFSASLYVEG